MDGRQLMRLMKFAQNMNIFNARAFLSIKFRKVMRHERQTVNLGSVPP